MIKITDKSKCCGCTACASVCPKQCIIMEPDQEGFFYPKVNLAECIHCNRCEKVCSVINKVEVRPNLAAYVARNKNEEILYNSSSGGFFSALCSYVISHGGIVFGAGFDGRLDVKHMAAETLDACKTFRGSKYVQSDLDGIFKDVEKELKAGRLTCFSGTPCQVAGLYSFLGSEYENLILVDLVCHGVSTPEIWKQYRDLMEKKRHAKIVKANFRSKYYGYQSSSMMLTFDDGSVYHGSPRVDIMLKSFYVYISMRPSCYVCPNKGEERCSDFTIWDCWHAEDILGRDVGDVGDTSVLVRGEKAKSIISVLREDGMRLDEVAIDKIIPINGGMMIKSSERNEKRDEYLACVARLGLEKAFDKYLKVKPLDFAIEYSKCILCRTGILHKVSRWKKMQKKRKQQS